MPWSGEEQQHPLFQHIQALIRLRKEHPAFHPRVPLRFVHVDANLLVMQKQIGANKVLLCLDDGNEAVSCELPDSVRWREALTNQAVNTSISIEPGSARVYVNC
ncbi:MAG: hypothetical protein ACRC17_01695 [Culicoidibacterales bacterium]